MYQITCDVTVSGIPVWPQVLFYLFPSFLTEHSKIIWINTAVLGLPENFKMLHKASAAAEVIVYHVTTWDFRCKHGELWKQI